MNRIRNDFVARNRIAQPMVLMTKNDCVTPIFIGGRVRPTKSGSVSSWSIVDQTLRGEPVHDLGCTEDDGDTEDDRDAPAQADIAGVHRVAEGGDGDDGSQSRRRTG